jgi:hypothetical protein
VPTLGVPGPGSSSGTAWTWRRAACYAPFVDILRTLERELPADEGGATIGPLRAALGSPPADTGRTRGGPRPRPVRAGAGLRAVAQPRAQRAVAKANAGAWMVAIGEDLRYPETRGGKVDSPTD